MSFNDFGYNFASNKKSKLLHTFTFRFFVNLLPSLTKEWPYTTLWLFEKGAIKKFLRAKIWLDGLDSVFC